MCSPTEHLPTPVPLELPLRSSLLANPFTDPVVQLLDELVDLVSTLTDAQYTQRPVGVIPSNIGAHVRHCLDHVAALLKGAQTGFIDYDARERGTEVENHRASAIEAMSSLSHRLAQLDLSHCERPVLVELLMTCDGPKVGAPSSVARELAFVLSHTIHHNAIIGAMVRTLGGSTPERFGYAPATVARMQREAAVCARSA